MPSTPVEKFCRVSCVRIFCIVRCARIWQHLLMQLYIRFLTLITFLNLPLAVAGDWPCWRGPDRNGVADADQNPPLEFGPDKNVRWVTPIPGRGHGSPVVVGNRVILQTADEAAEQQLVICFDRLSGKPLWTTEVHRGSFPQLNQKATHASSTPASDGERIYVNFVNGTAAWTTALDLNGRQLWQKKICNYKVHQGYGSSPTLYKSLVIVSADNKLGGALCAFQPTDGSEVWRMSRATMPNYASPIVLHVDRRDQLFLTGCNRVSSYDPLTGKLLWEMVGSTTECVTSTVTDGQRIFSSGGYPKNHVAAFSADGSKKLKWQNKSRVYVPSMLIKDGYLYAVLDAGLAACWKSSNGDEKWKARLGGNFSSSPVLIGDRIYVANERGEFSIFKANPKTFQLLAKSQLGDEVFATPTIVDGQIFARVAYRQHGTRQEKLYCLARED